MVNTAVCLCGDYLCSLPWITSCLILPYRWTRK